MTTTGLRRNPLRAEPSWLRVESRGAIGVDREAKRINGYVVAQEGLFREPNPRGEFDHKSLSGIVRLMRESSGGTKVRFGHPTLSGDGIGKYLGRSKSPRLDSVTVKRGGETVTLEAVRADLHLSETAFAANPNGNLGQYLLDLAEHDPAAFASSLVLDATEEYRLAKDGSRALSETTAKPLPPLWRPTAIHASDMVDEGAAVDAMLAAGGLPDDLVRQAAALLDRQFAGCSREVVEARALAWLDRYLAHRFGGGEPAATIQDNGDGDRLRLSLALIDCCG